ncbi:hypothetical protein D3875_02950 [Deinococcus cavernae]|uniref:Uncharacterized protein n=1 Tax=Deinococcus cavernae TaxID=2320857 RepID=A0A418VFZ1_9DEIO|nr:hypothetical protein [Deinococcus cavernae]RJF74971.1 hypothetical protein D3875_02950 [Deinococcus cavernae]
MSTPVKNAAEAAARAYEVLRHEAIEQELAEVLAHVGRAADDGETSLTNLKITARTRIALGRRLRDLGFQVRTNQHSPHAKTAQLSLAWPAAPEDDEIAIKLVPSG